MSKEGQQSSPPINNLLQPDIYNRLDAQALERTRVVNTQLDERLRAQHKLLAKYRLAAERHHRREKERVRHELTQLSSNPPPVSRIQDFRSKFLFGEGLKKSSSGSVPDLQARKVRGVPEERCNHPFCERFFIHHMPSKKTYYKARIPSPPLFWTAGGEGGDGGGGEGAVAVVPALTVSDVNAPQLQDNIDSVQRVNEPCPNGTDSSADANFLISQTEPTGQLAPNVELMPSGDTHSVKNGNRSPRQSGKGRELDRKSPRRPTRKTSLPSIQRQAVKLARSSPSLFQG